MQREEKELLGCPVVVTVAEASTGSQQMQRAASPLRSAGSPLFLEFPALRFRVLGFGVCVCKRLDMAMDRVQGGMAFTHYHAQ